MAKGIKGKIEYYSGCLAYGSLFLSALTQCIAIAPGNLFLISAILFGIIYACCITKEIKERFLKFKYWLLSFLFFSGCLLITCFTSPEMSYSLTEFFYNFLYRASPFLAVVILFPKPRYVSTILLASIFSCFVDCAGGIARGPVEGWRIKGLFGSTMTLAGFLCTAIPLAFCGLFDFKQKHWEYFIWLLVFVVFIAALLLNGTRGAWIAVAVTLLIVGAWFSKRSKKNFLLLMLVCVAIAGYVGSSDRYVARLKSVTSTTFSSNTERVAMWKTATKMLEDHPLTGVGFKRFSKEFQDNYTRPKQKIHKYNHPHSNIFYVLADSGLVGFCGYAFFFLFVLAVSLKGAFKDGNIYHLLIFSITLAIQLQGLTEYNFGNQAVIKYYWLFLGCCLALTQKNANRLLLIETSKCEQT